MKVTVSVSIMAYTVEYREFSVPNGLVMEQARKKEGGKGSGGAVMVKVKLEERKSTMKGLGRPVFKYWLPSTTY